MFTAALGLTVNVIGHFGVPSLGARGCALATVAAQWSMLVAMHLYQRRHPVYRRFGLFARFEWPARCAASRVRACPWA